MRQGLKQIWERMFHRKTGVKTQRAIESFEARQAMCISASKMQPVAEKNGIQKWMMYGLRMHTDRTTKGLHAHYLGVSYGGEICTWHIFLPSLEKEDQRNTRGPYDWSRPVLISRQKVSTPTQQRLLFLADAFFGWEAIGLNPKSAQEKVDLYLAQQSAGGRE